MSSVTLGLICFGCVSTGILSGFTVNRLLPANHISSDSRDTIKMAWGIVATMSALVLSLLLSSAKLSFDTINGEATQAGAKIIVLDQVLDRYGPETKAAREELRATVAARMQKIWPDAVNTVGASQGAPSVSTALATGKGMRGLQDKLGELIPQTDVQRALLAQAEQLTTDLIMSRWLVVEQSRTFLPPIFYWVLVFWLTMLFTGLGLLAPPNKTVLLAIFICNMSLSAAVFLVEEMTHPLDGIIRISTVPMHEAMEYLQQPMEVSPEARKH